MNFAYFNPKNVRHLVPAWAFDHLQLTNHMNMLMAQYMRGKSIHWDRRLNFWIEFVDVGGGFQTRIAEPENEDEAQLCGQLWIDLGMRAISVPLNDMLKGAPSLEGRHSIYFHVIDTDVPLHYVGVTKQRWFDRLSQHESSARNGSPYIFHRALREHSDKRIVHRCLITSLDEESAMELEEEFVEKVGLYPKGLNMIPGGYAGIRYLHTLGIVAKGARERDEQVERLSAREDVVGSPNPLCAARWAADQDFVNRVICGHSGRLSVDQVRAIRMLSASGKAPEGIAEIIGDAVARVKNVLAGKRYSRAA